MPLATPGMKKSFRNSHHNIMGHLIVLSKEVTKLNLTYQNCFCNYSQGSAGNVQLNLGWETVNLREHRAPNLMYLNGNLNFQSEEKTKSNLTYQNYFHGSVQFVVFNWQCSVESLIYDEKRFLLYCQSWRASHWLYIPWSVGFLVSWVVEFLIRVSKISYIFAWKLIYSNEILISCK